MWLIFIAGSGIFSPPFSGAHWGHAEPPIPSAPHGQHPSITACSATTLAAGHRQAWSHQLWSPPVQPEMLSSHRQVGLQFPVVLSMLWDPQRAGLGDHHGRLHRDALPTGAWSGAGIRTSPRPAAPSPWPHAPTEPPGTPPSPTAVP